MTKAALLSTCGDPFITSLVLKLWKRDWYEEIDKLYLNINNHCHVPKEVIGEFISNWVDEPKMVIINHPSGIGNGPPQVENLKICNEDLVLLLEDDFFIYTKGIVSMYFSKIESGECDLLGSPRYSYGEVAEAAKKAFNLDYSGEGDKGMGWWPTGFYCKRTDLLRTDLDFGSKKYPKGTYFKKLDHTFTEDCYTDTFTWASLQLRSLGLKAIDIPQYHAMPFIKDQKTDIPYIHGGSLSSGWGGYLSGQTPDVSHDVAKQEMESRCAFWEIASADGVVEGFSEFKRQYRDGLYKLENAINVDRNRLESKIKIYRDLMKL